MNVTAFQAARTKCCRNSIFRERLGCSPGQGLGFQFKMRVMGEAAPSSAARLTRNRWLSEDTAYCCLRTPGTGPPAMRTGNRAVGVPVCSDCPSGDNFTGAAIILLSTDTSKISWLFLFQRGCAPPLLEIRDFPPGPGNGC